MAKIDPYLLEVLRSAFDTIADNLAITVMRTAYSEIVRESLDFSTALCDANGQTLAQGVCTPMHLGSFHDAMDNLRREQAGDIHPGDVFIFNDPFLAAGQHLPDIYVVAPVFVAGRVEGWATTLAHHSDVGGIVAGSNALGAVEVFQEGLRLPVLKLYEKGKPNSSVWKIIEANVRTPKLVFGDLHAQVAACTNGVREFTELIDRYGIDTIRAAGEALHEHAERLVRAELAEFPKGDYAFTDHIDGLGENPEPVVFKVKVSFTGDGVIVDWTGTSPQVAGGINSTFPFTKSCAYAAIRSVLRQNIPNCHGFTVPIEVRSPEGTVVRPLFPAPTGARGITGYRMLDCLMGALAQAVPDRATADGSGGSSLPTFSGTVNGKQFIFCETLMGTSGACAAHDGQEGVAHIGANQANVPVELIEARYPLRVEEYGFVKDSGGAGSQRGGMAIRRSYRILSDRATLNIRSDKRANPPHGLFGGQAGAGSMTVIRRGSDGIVVPALPTSPIPLRVGDVVEHTMPAGGGWGDPAERAHELVRKDLMQDRISAEAARDIYKLDV
ncbi:MULTISPECIES: hydantoinase B/oxoprolinase family protein [Ramlibacter]|uniref:Hydantoinase B/oxoprolinase family protein n=1 Tax=Ramlibacter pinisoli TaxID=2682844 RepID=A0A6N8IV37_9BURK|nr:MULTISPECIES: hydantoinase B/oxoprolinase family protein [Ramlibacter]MBA2965035.1 hydantoinase B/oxoprolinase family protein [Ramlibacter sp. CGMCC 1.13660]MVQ30000.1 hydantoinase B/oxoprolinase family protein [Ramlibacter pinisoli]